MGSVKALRPTPGLGVGPKSTVCPDLLARDRRHHGLMARRAEASFLSHKAPGRGVWPTCERACKPSPCLPCVARPCSSRRSRASELSASFAAELRTSASGGSTFETSRRSSDYFCWRHSRGYLLYTSDAADDLLCVDLGGRR